MSEIRTEGQAGLRSGQKSDAIPLALKRVLMLVGYEKKYRTSLGTGMASDRRGAARQGLGTWLSGYNTIWVRGVVFK